MTGEYGDGGGKTGDGVLTWQLGDEALMRDSGGSTYTTLSSHDQSTENITSNGASPTAQLARSTNGNFKFVLMVLRICS